ncbi:major pollen allergen Lol p 11-like [Phragmites australis]|uniref:major pollen allergen Lol p 11-like n=1 Tax=Phragmites australis TaxID=29695 RepID=UPI002D773CC0|nr:major pollen allergen Lol p 11-like [Phragmites australis]
MPQLRSLIALLLTFSAVAAVASAAPPAPGPPEFLVTGVVYCDTCRAGFETNVSHSLKGATVQIECKHFESQEVHHKAEATTDAWGWYKVEVGEDHQEEICEVALLRSPEADCAEIERSRDRARVPLTRNNGIKQSGIRYANSIAFFRKEPLKNCGEILRKYDLYDDSSENP